MQQLQHGQAFVPIRCLDMFVWLHKDEYNSQNSRGNRKMTIKWFGIKSDRLLWNWNWNGYLWGCWVSAAWPGQLPPFNKCLGCWESNWPGKLSIKLFYIASGLDMRVNFPLDALLEVKLHILPPKAILHYSVYERCFSLKMRESAVCSPYCRISIS